MGAKWVHHTPDEVLSAGYIVWPLLEGLCVGNIFDKLAQLFSGLFANLCDMSIPT